MRRFLTRLFKDDGVSFIIMFTFISLLSIFVQACAVKHDKESVKKADTSELDNVRKKVALLKREFPESNIYKGEENPSYYVLQGEKLFQVDISCGCFGSEPSITNITPIGQY